MNSLRGFDGSHCADAALIGPRRSPGLRTLKTGRKLRLVEVSHPVLRCTYGMASEGRGGGIKAVNRSPSRSDNLSPSPPS